MILRTTGWMFKTEVRLATSNSNSSNRIDYFQNNNTSRRTTVVVCGLRSCKKTKPPSMVISKESVQVIHALKLAKNSDEKLNQVLKSRLLRLLKNDVLDVLAELHRQNQLHLSLKVLEFIISDEEAGYDKFLLPLYSDTILLLGKNKMIEMAEDMFNRVLEKGLKPDTRLYNEMIGVYLQVGNTEKAMEIYRSMKDSGCLPDELTFTILIRSLMKNGEHELVETLKKESFDYVNAPDKFVQKVQQNHLIIRDEEAGYDTSLLPLYSEMLLLLGRNKMIEMAEEMFNRVVEKGLKPDTKLFKEMIAVYLQVGNTEKAIDVYRSMKASGIY